MNRQHTKVLPQIEVLEDRCVPTTATFGRGVLRVTGTNAAEAIRINQAGAKIVVQGVLTVKTSQCRQIVVDANGGNDVIDLRNVNVRATINAGAGNDFVVGSKAADVIFGSDGDDRIFGMTGHDVLSGDNGNDFLFGMEHSDTLLGGAGDDFLDDGNRGLQEYADGGAGLDWNADIVAVGGATIDDIHQRGSPSCSFLSSLAGLSRQGRDFTQWIRYAGFQSDGTPLYQVAFWQGTNWHWQTVAFTGALNGLDTAPATEGESWVVLMNRAWMQYHGGNGRCWPNEAVYALTGVSPWTQGGVTNNDYGRIATALDQGRLVIIATGSYLSTSLLETQHAYTVVSYRTDGSMCVRNPWGYDNDNGVASGNSSDGYIWLSWYDVMASFNYLAIA